MKLGVLDECEVDLRSHLDGCVAFLEAARAAAVDRPAGNGALVHCYMGRSRSVTVAAAFIAAVRGCSAQEALEQIRERRPDARPNDGFREQLEHWVAERSGDVPAPRV
jgi:protein-tyrosine phosphatase